ncbi:ABC transporter permease [Tardisphaera saccharovorans]
MSKASGSSVSKKIKDFVTSLRVSIRLITSTTQGKIGFTIVLGAVLLSILAPLFPYPGVAMQNLVYEDALPSIHPSFWYILGGDYNGAPFLLDIIYGLQYFMIVGVVAAAITVSIGVVLGVISGYVGGYVDQALNFVFSLLLTIPSFALWLVLAVIFRNAGPITLGFILGILSWGGLARAIRSVALSNKAKDFVEASRALGLSSWSIISNDILPGIMPYVFMNFMLAINNGIYGSMGLALLGLLPFTAINWGIDMNIAIYRQGAVYNFNSTIPLIIITIISTLLLMGFVFLANASDRVFDPQKRKEAENVLASKKIRNS